MACAAQGEMRARGGAGVRQPAAVFCVQRANFLRLWLASPGCCPSARPARLGACKGAGFLLAGREKQAGCVRCFAPPRRRRSFQMYSPPPKKKVRSQLGGKTRREEGVK